MLASSLIAESRAVGKLGVLVLEILNSLHASVALQYTQLQRDENLKPDWLLSYDRK